MNDAEKLEYYLGLDYEVRIVHKDDGFELGIPELGLRKGGKDVAKVHAELMAAKDEWIRELCAQRLYSWIMEPGGGFVGTQRVQPQSLKQQLTPFAIKTAVVAIMLLAVGTFLGSAISAAGRGMERDLHRIPEWSDEKVEKYRTNARRIAEKLRPIFAEIMPLLQAGPQNPTAAAGGGQAGGTPVQTEPQK